MADTATEIDLDSVIDRLLEGERIFLFCLFGFQATFGVRPKASFSRTTPLCGTMGFGAFAAAARKSTRQVVPSPTPHHVFTHMGAKTTMNCCFESELDVAAIVVVHRCPGAGNRTASLTLDD